MDYPVKISIFDEYGNKETSLTGICKYDQFKEENNIVLHVYPFSYFSSKLPIKHLLYKIKKMIIEHKKILPDYVPTEYNFTI